VLRKMNPDEKIVFDYLLQLNVGEVIWEPGGNTPPDFSINSKIAVEARRLNQNYQNSDSYEGLEILSSSLEDVMSEVFHSFDERYTGKSYFVGYFYKRPIGSVNKLKKEIKLQLIKFLNENMSVPTEIPFGDNFQLWIIDRPPLPGVTFRLAGLLDHDSGGFIVSEYVKNINLCIQEKNNKIQNYLHKYLEWWLVLVDQTDLIMDAEDQPQIVPNINCLGSFNQLLVINQRSLVPIFVKNTDKVTFPNLKE